MFQPCYTPAFAAKRDRSRDQGGAMMCRAAGSPRRRHGFPWQLFDKHGEQDQQDKAVRAWRAAQEIVSPDVDWAWNYRITQRLRHVGEEPGSGEGAAPAAGRAVEQGLELLRRRNEAGNLALAEQRAQDAIAAYRSARELMSDMLVDLLDHGSKEQQHEVARLHAQGYAGESQAYEALGDLGQAVYAADTAVSVMRDAERPPEEIRVRLGDAVVGYLLKADAYPWFPPRVKDFGDYVGSVLPGAFTAGCVPAEPPRLPAARVPGQPSHDAGLRPGRSAAVPDPPDGAVAW